MEIDPAAPVSQSPATVAYDADTIAAISTPPGEGGVGIVRVSGPHAIPIAARIFVSSRGLDIQTQRQRVFHGQILDSQRHVLDEVLLHLMRAPHTYTREDVVEINGHGGPAPLNAILDEVLRQGARLAQPGEFTRRAFLNGRIDLVQAEAVMDQIQARTQSALQAAHAAAGGQLSCALHRLRDTLAEALAYVEAAVDFPEEDLPELVTPALIQRLHHTHHDMLELLDTADTGRLYREGAIVTIAGRPNVGKSSLFNALLRDARAIVSPQPGTTRDRIEEYITVAGLPVKLIDTAGLRISSDTIEQAGVDLARRALRSAHLALFVLDASVPTAEEDYDIAHELNALNIPVILALNKSDCVASCALPEWDFSFASVVSVSALTGNGLKELENAIGKVLLRGGGLAAGDALLTRTHQKESLRRAAECIANLLKNPSHSPEFLALDLRGALEALGEITGETTPDHLLDIIFSQFCIGK